MIFGTLSVVEMALGALGIPHGKGGVQAAVEFLAKSGAGVAFDLPKLTQAPLIPAQAGIQGQAQ